MRWLRESHVRSASRVVLGRRSSADDLFRGPARILAVAGLVYLFAFISVWVQVDGLMGEGGWPGERLLRSLREASGTSLGEVRSRIRPSAGSIRRRDAAWALCVRAAGLGAADLWRAAVASAADLFRFLSFHHQRRPAFL